MTSIDDGTGPNTLAYDEIGNLTNDTKYDYTWEEGRQLSSMNKVSGGLTINFKYNADGIRTEKMVNGVTTKYHLAGDQVTYETNGADNIYYTYGADGNLISMNLNGAEYYYIRNGQNDIIGLFDGAGTQVVSYTYDAWGKLISTDGSLKDTVGVKNPYRYRGYRYDTETGLYYLQSRYYNPEWGRFLNADGLIGQIGDLIEHNLFVYCQNNPINLYDPYGYQGLCATWTSTAWTLTLVDGPLPIGDVIYGGGIVITYVADNATTIANIGSAAWDWISRVTDSSKNEKHGDSGRALGKAEKQIAELEKELAKAKSKDEKRNIKKKIENIRKNAQKKNSGESHSQANKR